MNKLSCVFIGGVVFAATIFHSCIDDDYDTVTGHSTRAAETLKTPAGLIQQADGTWKSQNCRVPIVGPGRVVNEINTSTVNVIGIGQNGLGNIIDTDLTNECTIPAAVSADVAFTPIVSVKDMYHTYAAGQKVGFVYKDTEGGSAKLLSLDLLKAMTLETYLNGKKQESAYASQEGSALKVDLISFNTGNTVSDRVLAFNATKPFDEVRMSIAGVSASAATNIALAIKYAFVGENPEIRATSEDDFTYYWTGGSPEINKGTLNSLTNVASANNLVDKDTTNSATFTSELALTSKATINFKKDIPTGTEIGFYYKTGKLAGLDLFGQESPILTTYDANNKEKESSDPDISVLSLSLIGGSSKTFTNLVTTETCRQIQFQHPRKLLDLGGMLVYYAYVREGVKPDPVNYFTFGNDTTYNDSYRLPTMTEGQELHYNILSSPYGSEAKVEGTTLSGLTKDGSYRLQAVYTAADGRQVSHEATIYHKSNAAQSGCNTYITALTNGAYATEALGASGCLLCLFNGSNNLNNVVDNDFNNYATTYQAAAVGEVSPIAAFKMNNPVVPYGTGKVRTGFIVQANTALLNLSALNAYEIRLYNGSTLVTKGTAEAQSLQLGVLGFDRSKVRISVETDKEFDRVELWCKSIANVLTALRIYNLFYEPTSCSATAEGGGCMELMTNLKDDLQIDYEHTKLAVGVLSVGNAFKDLDYILDGSAETGALLNNGVSLGGSTIALKFRQQKANQTVGIVLGNLPDILTADISKIGVLKVYNDDKEITHNTGVDIVGANLLSEGGRTYIEVTPTEPFNRITFTVGGLQLLDTSKLCGVYLRPDSDGDGIPDCTDTGDVDGSLTITEEGHTCYGETLTIPIAAGADTQNDKDVSIYCYNEDTKKEIHTTGKVQNDKLEITTKLPVGRYLLYIYSGNNNQLIANDVKATIHPLETTWKTNAASTDWNTWTNWSNGSPWTCTNVVIPSNASRYPELTSTSNNYCAGIHFEAGAEVVGTQYLTMDGYAFVDMYLRGGRNYLASAPLQEMYTGDMFISPGVQWGKSNYFNLLTTGNYKESRTQPIVYQRFWNSEATEMIADGDTGLKDTEVGTAEWSAEFNAVATPYNKGQGFLLRAGSTGDNNGYTFRFPKTHTRYTYFRSNGTSTGRTESISRTEANIGQFTLQKPGDITLRNRTSGTMFLMGNPFMAHIDVQKLVAENPNIAYIMVSDGNSFNPLIEADGQLVSSKDNQSLLIAPMEAFFIVAKTAEGSLTVKLTADMLTQKSKETTTGSTSQNLLQITAANGNNRAACTLVRTSRSSDDYRRNEDATLMIDKSQSGFAMFSTAAGKALSVQQLNGRKTIPLGFIMRERGTVTLNFNHVGNRWKGWKLHDNHTGKKYALQGKLTITDVNTGSRRFTLEQ